MNYKLPNNREIFCYRPDELHAQMAIDGFYELFWPILQGQTMVAIDVGTSCGDSTIVMAGCLSTKSLVLGIEPSKQILPLLLNNLSKNPWGNFHVHNIAASDTNGTIEFIYGSDNGGVIDEENVATRQRTSPPYMVNMVNLYPYLQATYKDSPHVLNNVGFIKIDTEGYDFKVLRSLSPLLIAKPIPTILEWWPEIANSEKLFSVINALPYRAFNVRGEPISHSDFGTTRYTLDIILKPV